MTVLDRLARKGLIRREFGRDFLYAPLVSRDFIRRQALQEFLDAFF